MKSGCFFAYLKARRWCILLLITILALLFAVYGLYGLPRGPAAYTALLIAVLSLGAGLLDYRHVRKKAALLAALERETVLQLEMLPQPGDLLEERYQAILRTLNRRCTEAEQQKEQALRDASQYYLRWSHQAKTPLAAMRLLLQEEPVSAALLSQELLKLEQYVEMALQYQRLGSGFDDLVLQAYPLERLCREAIKRTAPLFIHKKIAVHLGDFHQMVLTDEKGLCFVLEQLLTNAVKYTRSGGEVSLSLEEDTLVVADNGIGILPEDLPRVFDWGYTGQNGRLDKRSTGIGLALCRQTMVLLGHGISIESQVGKGTRVQLHLGRKKLPMD